MSNIDLDVVKAFGEEWSKFDHSERENPDLLIGGGRRIFPLIRLPQPELLFHADRRPGSLWHENGETVHARADKPHDGNGWP